LPKVPLVTRAQGEPPLCCPHCARRHNDAYLWKRGSLMELWTAVEAARYLKLHVETLRRKSRAGEVPALRLGGQWRYRKDLLDEWMTRNSPSEREHSAAFGS